MAVNVLMTIQNEGKLKKGGEEDEENWWL